MHMRAPVWVLFWRVVFLPFPACKQLRLPLKSAEKTRELKVMHKELCVNFGPMLEERSTRVLRHLATSSGREASM